MEILEVNQKEYNQVINNPYHKFTTADFNSINANKCSTVYYLLFKETKYRLGIIGGIIDGIFNCPFSAPFGGFSYVNKNIGINYIDDAIDKLVNWAKTKKLDGINLILPPPIYDQSFVTKQINCLYRKNFKIERIELNYIFYTKKFNDGYFDNIRNNGRNNLRKALKQNLRFIKCKNLDEKKLSFDIIRRHKNFKKYPLKMTWSQIEDTINVIDADFFLVLDMYDNPIASSMVYWVSEKIVQIIYWGDLQEYSQYKTMNFLSYKLFEYYTLKEIEIIDLGPSSENSFPNIGLGNFKESIGCEILTKIYFTLPKTAMAVLTFPQGEAEVETSRQSHEELLD